ncbi:hypothetical protein P4604_21705 [Lysinibacillus capsici]|uniref:hypothetical protein n=1 Tax=Lysinibacillus capsici TaxID=2115968 RepID=UPI002E1E062B|nr:hypothetical protein [Lysinibacillus capsici]
MKIPKNLSELIYEVACDEVERIHGVDLRETHFKENVTLNHKLTKTLIQAISASTLIQYHLSLHKELLKHGIDIGELETERLDEP